MTEEYKSTLEMLVEPNKNLFGLITTDPITTDKIPDNVKKEFLKEVNKNLNKYTKRFKRNSFMREIRLMQEMKKKFKEEISRRRLSFCFKRQ